MRLRLHQFEIDLFSDDAAIRQHWARLFEGWLANETVDTSAEAPIALTLHLTHDPLPLPDEAPFFNDANKWGDGRGVLSVYATEDKAVLLHFQDGALITVPLPDAALPDAPMRLKGLISAEIVASDRFEDVVFTSLAAALRRHGAFLVHAFAAARGDEAVLIVGQTHSGKTTAGLSLLMSGWQLLSNDVVLVEERPDGIYALPTPGDVGIRPFTFTLLPDLLNHIGADAPPQQAYNLSAERFIRGNWATPARISAVAMPTVRAEEPTALAPAPRALSLARLMEESIDRWDGAQLLNHMTILQQTCSQSRSFALTMGRGVSAVASLLESALSQPETESTA